MVTTTAMTRATKKIARRLAQAVSSIVTMGSASRELIGATMTMTAAMAAMKKGKIFNINIQCATAFLIL